MPAVVDFHAHILPGPLEKPIFERLPKTMIEQWRKRARGFMRPFASALHRTQTVVRHLPEGARKQIDGLAGIAPLPNLLFESTAGDLKEAMNEAGVDYAVIIAHPQMIPNELVLEAAQEDPRMIAAVNLPPGTLRVKATLKKFHDRGARLLKIHPAADGEKPDAKHYQTLLATASDLGIPVILHTGCIHSHLLYKDPEMGRAELFEPWFEKFPKTQFILAHMNFHAPVTAMDLAQKYENLWVDTSWQPAETIGEAVRRIGPERVLFATDWPFMGNNLTIGLKRIRECIEIGLLTEDQAAMILGKNALTLLTPVTKPNAP